MTETNRIISPDFNYGGFAAIKSETDLNRIVIQQMRILTADDGVKKLEGA